MTASATASSDTRAGSGRPRISSQTATPENQTPDATSIEYSGTKRPVELSVVMSSRANHASTSTRIETAPLQRIAFLLRSAQILHLVVPGGFQNCRYRTVFPCAARKRAKSANVSVMVAVFTFG